MQTEKTSAVGRRVFMKQASVVLGATACSNIWVSCATPDAPGKSQRNKTAFNQKAADLEQKSLEYLGIAPDEGRLLHLLIRTAHARNVLELGTCFGLGTIWMGLALEETGGQITSIEILKDRADQARKLVAEAALTIPITLTQGDAHALVPKLTGTFDLVVLNADKTGNLDYFNQLYPKLLRPNALILALGAISRRDKMQDYLDTIMPHPDFDSVAISATPDEGLVISSRRPA